MDEREGVRWREGRNGEKERHKRVNDTHENITIMQISTVQKTITTLLEC